MNFSNLYVSNINQGHIFETIHDREVRPWRVIYKVEDVVLQMCIVFFLVYNLYWYIFWDICEKYIWVNFVICLCIIFSSVWTREERLNWCLQFHAATLKNVNYSHDFSGYMAVKGYNRKKYHKLHLSVNLLSFVNKFTKSYW